MAHLLTQIFLPFPRRARGERRMNALQCARYVYQTEGVRGFYRGLTASYAGISETMICFLIYETLKKHMAEQRMSVAKTEANKGASDFLGLMLAAAFAKGCASCVAYPHGTPVATGQLSTVPLRLVPKVFYQWCMSFPPDFALFFFALLFLSVK